MIKTLTPIVGILSIVGLEFYALSQGINGVMLAGSIAIIAGLAGYSAKTVKNKVTKKNGEEFKDGDTS